MNLEVNIKEIPTQQIASISRRQTVDGLSRVIQKDCDTLFTLVGEQGATVTGAPFGIYHGAVSEQEDGPMETCVPVDGKVTGKDDVEVRQLTGGNAACVTIYGEQCRYPELLSAYDAAADWIQKNGYETAEPPREIWYTEPGPEAKWEIVWLFK
jgi:effector-binding domain-containing protein